jgi:predicted GIY-YIG superfamily endonuclease
MMNLIAWPLDLERARNKRRGFAMGKPRDTWLYELKDGNEIVYYGISGDPDVRAIQHANSGKKFTHVKVISMALTRESAERREKGEIQRYQRQHGGRAPKYNIAETY